MIDFRSDTITRPTQPMREAARDATVGDDKRDGDPTVAELEERVADRLGMDAGLFVPSGTMGNQVAVHVHAEPGQEVIVDRKAHVYNFEYGDLALLSGLQVRPIDAAGTAAHDRGLPVHLDGARLANAAVALDHPLDVFTGHVDSVMFDLSKGLGAPIGAVLVGDADFIETARNVRNAFGGGMRQAGIVAAAGIESLADVGRLAEDHGNAAHLVDRIDRETDFVTPTPDTNILFVDTEPAGVAASDVVDRLAENEIRAQPVGEHAIRFCTHCDVSRADVETTADLLADAF